MLKVFWNPRDGQPPSVAEQFFFNPSEVLKNETLLDTSVSPSQFNMTSIPSEIFANRLTMFWNTWSMATKDNGLLTGYEFRKSPFTRYLAPTQSLLVNQSAEWSFQRDLTYHVDITWFVLYMASVAIMLLCSILSIVIKVQLKIPDVLGYVSSLTRDSLYTILPVTHSASTLEGKKRAFLLKDYWIRFEDVQSNEEIGRLAIQTDKALAPETLPLSESRMYD
jgi:hypothetical protein